VQGEVDALETLVTVGQALNDPRERVVLDPSRALALRARELVAEVAEGAARVVGRRREVGGLEAVG